MAKDLPYFKFFCSEWNDGDIALEDYEVQGLFINLCSYYWSNECDLTFKKAEKKFKDAPEDLWQTLLESNIIKEVDSFLIITFLDEQKGDRIERSKIRSKGGKASAEARRLKKLKEDNNISSTEKQHVLNSSSTQVQLLREEKRREEEKREENTNTHTHESFLIWFKECREYLGLKYNAKKLTMLEKQSFNEVKDYSREDFKLAFSNFSKDKYYVDNNLLFPMYFLKPETFTKYLNAEVKTKLTIGQKLAGGIE